MRTALDRLYLWSGYLAGAFLVIIFALMLALSAGRPLGLNIPSGDDFAAWSMAACAFLGLAHTFKHGEMIRVGLLIDRLGGRTRHLVELVSLIIGLGFVAFFAWHAARFTLETYWFQDMSTGVVAVPLWIPQLGFSGGLAILTIAFADELIRVVRGQLPSYHKEPPKTAEEAVERAIAGGA